MLVCDHELTYKTVLYGEIYSSHHTKNREAIRIADVAMDVKKELKQSVAVEEVEKLLL